MRPLQQKLRQRRCSADVIPQLWALATADHRAPSLVSSASSCLAAHVGELDAADLANALWATAMLRAYDPDFAAAVVEQAWDVLPHATPRQTVSILQGFAFLAQHDAQLAQDTDFMASITSRYHAQVRADVLLPPVHAARSLLTAARRPPTHACPQLPKATVSEIAVGLAALAELRHANRPLLDDAAGRLGEGAATAWLPALAEAAWALAVLQHPHAAFTQALAQRIAAAVQLATANVPPPGMQGSAAAAEAATAGTSTDAEARSGLAASTSAPSASHIGPDLCPGGRRASKPLAGRFNPAVPGDAPLTRVEQLHEFSAQEAAAIYSLDVTSKLLYHFTALHTWNGPVFTLLFRLLPRLPLEHVRCAAAGCAPRAACDMQACRRVQPRLPPPAQLGVAVAHHAGKRKVLRAAAGVVPGRHRPHHGPSALLLAAAAGPAPTPARPA